jgi:Haloacid dehalogenase-like hydrolase
MRRFGLEYRYGDGRAVYDEIPTWGPYPSVSEALKRLAQAYPLVIVTNSDDAHAPRLVENLQAPFEVVITAEQMGAYKPRLRAFEFMLDQLGAAPDEIVHVSASPKYDLRPAAVMGSSTRCTWTGASSRTSGGWATSGSLTSPTCPSSLDSRVRDRKGPPQPRPGVPSEVQCSVVGPRQLGHPVWSTNNQERRRGPLTRRNCLPASIIPAAHQRNAICPSRTA